MIHDIELIVLPVTDKQLVATIFRPVVMYAHHTAEQFVPAFQLDLHGLLSAVGPVAIPAAGPFHVSALATLEFRTPVFKTVSVLTMNSRDEVVIRAFIVQLHVPVVGPATPNTGSFAWVRETRAVKIPSPVLIVRVKGTVYAGQILITWTLKLGCPVIRFKNFIVCWRISIRRKTVHHQGRSQHKS